MFRNQKGLTSVEFALVGTVFFMVLFGVIEFGRTMFTWNMLSEAARRGARVAAVCPINHSVIPRVALFGAPGDSGPSHLLPALEEANIDLSYLDENGNVVPDPDNNFATIRYVRVAIQNYQHTLYIPFVNMGGLLPTPDFAATLPRESLGIPREDANPICFGTQT